jgi:D-alanyl-D-alanine dipeptidase
VQLRPPPDGLADLRPLLPDAQFEIGYATADNFTGAPLPGYGAPGCWLLPPAATALVQVAANLAAQGFGLVIWDGYRPARASRAMGAWAEKTGNTWILTQGFVALRSRHGAGVAIDLGLTRGGKVLDHGTPWDHFAAESAPDALGGEAGERRGILRTAMLAAGFTPYSREWWHFQWPAPDAPRRDVPYGADEDPHEVVEVVECS